MKTAYERIQLLKEKENIPTDREVERRAKLPNGTLQSIKKGRNVKHSTLSAIAEVLKTSLDYLISGEQQTENESDERYVFYAAFFNGLSQLTEQNRKKVLDYVEDLLRAQQAP